MPVLYPGQPVLITNPGQFVEHAMKQVVLERREMCENDEGTGGYPIWFVSPALRSADGILILWDEDSFTPLDGEVLNIETAEPLTC